MYIYRCTFILTEHNNMTSNLFVRALDEESAKNGSNRIFKEQCVKYGIPDAKFIQEVRIASEEEMEEYALKMKNNVKTRSLVN